jgi:hypothetical protein
MIMMREEAGGWQDVRTKLTIASQKILRILGIVIDLMDVSVYFVSSAFYGG